MNILHINRSSTLLESKSWEAPFGVVKATMSTTGGEEQCCMKDQSICHCMTALLPGHPCLRSRSCENASGSSHFNLTSFTYISAVKAKHYCVYFMLSECMNKVSTSNIAVLELGTYCTIVPCSECVMLIFCKVAYTSARENNTLPYT